VRGHARPSTRAALRVTMTARASRAPSDDPSQVVRVVGILYREATLAGHVNPPLAEWLRVTADTLTDNPTSSAAAVLALVIDGAHTFTYCDNLECRACRDPDS